MATEGQSQLPFEESYGLDLWLKDQVTIRVSGQGVRQHRQGGRLNGTLWRDHEATCMSGACRAVPRQPLRQPSRSLSIRTGREMLSRCGGSVRTKGVC